MPAHTYEQALISFLFSPLFSSLPGVLAPCDQYWSADWNPYALLHYSTFFL